MPDIRRRIILISWRPAGHYVPDGPELILIIISVAQDAESSSPAIFHSRKLAKDLLPLGGVRGGSLPLPFIETVRWECEKTYCEKYTLEKTYDLVGKNDYTSTKSFRPNSQSIKQNGNTLTIVFLYPQQERVNLVHNIKTAQFLHLLKNSLRSLAV